MERVYAAIDLKSFYASVECHERGLDPLTTNLVVADATRTDKTICLAISPSLKSYGLPGRARLFQVNEVVRQANADRLHHTSLGCFLGQSFDQPTLAQNPNLSITYITATPRMRHYLDYSAKIYQIYLKHVAPDDIFAYSIDEIFCDITSYLKMSHLSPEAFVTNMINDVYAQTGITATAGIGSNLFLAKIAMDILAKHAPANRHGVHLARLDERSFREQLWAHTPLTDFWRVGPGYAHRLSDHHLYTMGDIARCSLYNPKLLYGLFGVNAELLIDHAWGYEPVTIHDVKSHRPETKSLSSSQVLSCPYPYAKAEIIVREMAESLALDLVAKSYVTNHLVLHLDYDRHNSAVVTTSDRYGRLVPKPAHGTIRLPFSTSASSAIIDHFLKLYHEITNPNFTIRKITVCANDLMDENLQSELSARPELVQTNLFTNYANLTHRAELEAHRLRSEHRLQKAILNIRQRYGKNSILRGTNFEEGATMTARHRQIGGHRA